LNNFAIQVAKGNTPNNEYNGPIYKIRENNNAEESKEEEKYEQPKMNTKESVQSNELSELSKEETAGESLTKVVKRNSNRILHERNKYVFLASVAEDAITKKLGLSEYVGFALVKKLLMMIENLKTQLVEKKNFSGFEEWDHYVKTREFNDISKYITGEYEVFEVYFNCMYDRIGSLKKVHPKIDASYLDIVNKNMKKPIDKVFDRVIKDYVEEIVTVLCSGKIKDKDEIKDLWLHADQLVDCLRLDDNFKFEDSNKQQFNFKQWYEQVKSYDPETLAQRVKAKLKAIH